LPFEPPGYRIIRQVGTGAGSKIFLASQPSSGKSFAIKQVFRNGPDDDRFIEQVEAEYEVSHRLTHPFLRHSFEIHRVKKLLTTREVVLVMEYVDGLPIEQALPNRLNSFLTLFRRVADGLGAMHEAGYVHSDIKPTNIMVAQGGVVKIIDFGQSCKMHHKKTRIQGTPDYIAPEQVRRMPLDARTDVFNLGATMYWVLTQQKYPTALRGADQQIGNKNVVALDKPVAPNELNAKIPRSLSSLVMECCRDNPTERPANMNQVEARLATVQQLWKKYRESKRDNRAEASEPPMLGGAAPGVEESP